MVSVVVVVDLFQMEYGIWFSLVVAEIFKDTKKFNAKCGQEIQQTFTSLGFDIEYDCTDDQAVIKVCILKKSVFPKRPVSRDQATVLTILSVKKHSRSFKIH